MSFRVIKGELASLPLPEYDGSGVGEPAAGEALTEWVAEREALLGECPTREHLHSAHLLLQRRYFFLRRKHGASDALRRAYESAYERWEARLEQIDPPLTSKPRKPKAPAIEHLDPDGLMLGEYEP